jgi:hypothetical protein
MYRIAAAYSGGGALRQGLLQTGLLQTGLLQTGLLQTGLLQTGLLQTGLLQTGLRRLATCTCGLRPPPEPPMNQWLFWSAR